MLALFREFDKQLIARIEHFHLKDGRTALHSPSALSGPGSRIPHGQNPASAQAQVRSAPVLVSGEYSLESTSQHSGVRQLQAALVPWHPKTHLPSPAAHLTEDRWSPDSKIHRLSQLTRHTMPSDDVRVKWHI